MAVKRYDGSAWQVVAGKGDQGTSSSIATWVKTASGGETSLSGNDDNSQPLSYTVGQELVFINGALQKRGVDYTATTGTSITGLTALVANDVVTVWTVNAFSVTGAIANTLVDAKGDLIVATGADTPGILSVGSNDQVLTADSSTGTGLKWAAAASGKVVQIVEDTMTSNISTSNTNFSDTGLTVSITPTKSTNKVLVWVSCPHFGFYFNGSASNSKIRFNLLRDATSLLETQQLFSNITSSNGTNPDMSWAFNMMYVDSPSTTSSTTYKVQWKADGSSSYVGYMNGSTLARATILAIEVEI